MGNVNGKMSVKSAQNLLGRYLSLPSTGERPMRIAPSLLWEQREKGSSGDPRQDGPIPSCPPSGGSRSGREPIGVGADRDIRRREGQLRSLPRRSTRPAGAGAGQGGRPRGATTRPPSLWKRTRQGVPPPPGSTPHLSRNLPDFCAIPCKAAKIFLPAWHGGAPSPAEGTEQPAPAMGKGKRLAGGSCRALFRAELIPG